MDHYLLFLGSLLFSIIMLAEGGSIALLKKQITPLPARILYGLGVLVGKKQGRQRFAYKGSENDLRIYASWVLIFGASVLFSSVVYLFTAIL